MFQHNLWYPFNFWRHVRSHTGGISNCVSFRFDFNFNFNTYWTRMEILPTCNERMNEALWTNSPEAAAKEPALDPKCLRDHCGISFLVLYFFVVLPRGGEFCSSGRWQNLGRCYSIEVVCVTWITPSASSQLPSDSNTSNIWLIYLNAFANETK